MTRARGRAPGGERLAMLMPHGRRKTTAFIAAPRSDALTAPTAVDGAVDGELFEAYVRQRRAPTSRPGDTVVRDNLSGHKRAGVGAAIEAAGARPRYLPPYGPDLDPIERAFAELKALLRKAGEPTAQGLWPLPGRLLDGFAPEECRNYLKHCGYRATPTRIPLQRRAAAKWTRRCGDGSRANSTWADGSGCRDGGSGTAFSSGDDRPGESTSKADSDGGPEGAKSVS